MKNNNSAGEKGAIAEMLAKYGKEIISKQRKETLRRAEKILDHRKDTIFSSSIYTVYNLEELNVTR